MTYSRLLIPAIFLALSASATAQDGRRGERLQALDTNNDGAITRQEANAKKLQRFGETDTNNDGSITPEEIEAAMERRRAERRAERFAKTDTDGNGAISQAEFLASDRGSEIFDRLDSNDDDIISAAEIEAGQAARRGRGGPRGGRAGGPRPTSDGSGS